MKLRALAAALVVLATAGSACGLVLGDMGSANKAKRDLAPQPEVPDAANPLQGNGPSTTLRKGTTTTTTPGRKGSNNGGRNGNGNGNGGRNGNGDGTGNGNGGNGDGRNGPGGDDSSGPGSSPSNPNDPVSRPRTEVPLIPQPPWNGPLPYFGPPRIGTDATRIKPGLAPAEQTFCEAAATFTASIVAITATWGDAAVSISMANQVVSAFADLRRAQTPSLRPVLDRLEIGLQEFVSLVVGRRGSDSKQLVQTFLDAHSTDAYFITALCFDVPPGP